MAAIHVAIELREGLPTPASLEVLGAARRLGSRLGATVYAVVCVPMRGDARERARGDEALLDELGRHGADKVMRSRVRDDDARRLGDAVLAACELVPPSVLLLVDGEPGQALLDRLALRLGATTRAGAEAEAALVSTEPGHGVAPPRKWVNGLGAALALALGAGRHERAAGDEEAELIELATGDPAQALDATPGPAAPWDEQDTARVVVDEVLGSLGDPEAAPAAGSAGDGEQP